MPDTNCSIVTYEMIFNVKFMRLKKLSKNHMPLAIIMKNRF